MSRSALLDRRNRRFSRRALLQGIAGSAVMAPFVPLLQAETESGYPTRFIWLWQPDGTLYDDWVPQGTQSDFTLGPLLAPLQHHLDRLVVIDGLSLNYGGDYGGGHGIGSMQLAGSRIRGPGPAGGLVDDFPRLPLTPSVDQYIAERVGTDTAFSSLCLGVQHLVQPDTPLCVDGALQPVALENSPAVVFETLFGQLGEDALAQAKRKAQRKSVIDAVHGELDGIRTRHGAADRAKIDAHLDALRALEMANGAAISCDDPPVLDLGFDPLANDNFPLVTTAQIDLLVKALACDLTRVGGIKFSFRGTQAVHRWVGAELDHHCSIGHMVDLDPARRQDQFNISVWYAQQVAYLLDALAAVPEGDGTLLDHTVVLHMHELSLAPIHTNYPQPFLLAGGANGQLAGGRFLRYPEGVWHNRVLVSLCHMMGIPEQETFGNEDNDAGGLPGLLG